MMADLVNSAHQVSVAGSIPQWATLVVVALGLIKVWPNIKQMTIGEAAQLRKEIAELYEKLRKCEEECDQRCVKLQNELLAFKSQRISEQLALLSAFPNHMLTPQMYDLVERLNIQQNQITNEQEPSNDDTINQELNREGT